MQISCVTICRPFSQAGTKFFRPSWPREEPVQQSTQVEPGPSDNDRQAIAAPNACQFHSCTARILARRHLLQRIYEIEQMMGGAGTLIRSRFGCADIEVAIHRDGIAVHNLATKSFGENKGKRSLPAPRRPQNHDE